MIALLFRLLNRLLGRSDIFIDAGAPYMRRWKFGFDWTPGFRLHHILRSDADRELHDHPFGFISFILRGGYYEYRPVRKSESVILLGHDRLPILERRWYGPGSIVVRRAEDLHRLELATGPEGRPIPTWTFVLRTRYWREWGFLTSTGWITWREFANRRGARGSAAGEYATPSSL